MGLSKGFLIFIAVLILVSSFILIFDKWDWFVENLVPELIGGLITFLFGALIWDHYLKREREAENQLFHIKLEELNKLSSDMKQKIDYLERKAQINNSLFEILKSQKGKVQEIMLHCQKANPFVSQFYTRMLKAYHNNFRINQDGFYIENESLSLECYCLFWEYLILAQKERKDSNLKCIIARIVHSNSIRVWTNKDATYMSYTRRLLKLQRGFVEAGGIIVRIFIGPDKEPNQNYIDAMKVMTDNKIQIKYLARNEYYKLPYDFLLLHDENFVLKWMSDANGDSLAGTSIQDSVDSIVEEKWEDMFEELKKNGDPITAIPKDREFKPKKKTI